MKATRRVPWCPSNQDISRFWRFERRGKSATYAFINIAEGCDSHHGRFLRWVTSWIRPQPGELRRLRVPRVYLGSAFLRFFSLLPFHRINNLRLFNALSSSIPTAPTNSISLKTHASCLVC